MQEFSVLMSIYAKENPRFLEECLDSIFCQTVLPNEIVMVKDGPLTAELEVVLERYDKKYPSFFVFVPLEKNVGLGLALREGILHCSNELIARVDTDDINRSDRFERQLLEFEKNEKLDVCGCSMAEFEHSIDKIVCRRSVPIDDSSIKKYQKKRDDVNHPTVMYKKTAVLKAGNYQSCLLMEDSLLWVNMMINGAVFFNIDEDLYFFRIGEKMFERRGGYAYYKKYKAARKRIRKTGFISWWDYRFSLFAQFVVALLPNKVRGWVFKKILHK
jgi:glycosyltransferase involved in cell wall biosynthesis